MLSDEILDEALEEYFNITREAYATSNNADDNDDINEVSDLQFQFSWQKRNKASRIRNQGRTKNCVAFSTAAFLDSFIRIYLDPYQLKPNVSVDLLVEQRPLKKGTFSILMGFSCKHFQKPTNTT